MIIVLTGGGTAGHIMPNIALLPKLRQIFKSIHYIGDKNGMEKQLISRYPEIKYHGITTCKLIRKSILKNLALPINLCRGICESKRILTEIKPDIIFSKGGYVSVPVALAAKKLNIPLICHESDLTLGLANKLISRSAQVTCTSFEITAKNIQRGVWTGSPIRADLFTTQQNSAKQSLGIKNNLTTIGIVGGSQGAQIINHTIEKILPILTQKYQLIHLTGKTKKINFFHPNYYQLEFTEEIGKIFAACDILISRAGSNTIFELATLKKPMLLIPLKKGNSRGDQVDNAKYFKQLGIAKLLTEDILNEISLLEMIGETIKDAHLLKANLLKSKFEDGTENIIREIKKILRKKLIRNKTKN